MPRIWQIEEQVVTEKAVGFILEFTSTPTEGDDSTVVLNIYNEAKTKKLTMTFDRNGWFRDSELTGLSGADSIDTTAGDAASPAVPDLTPGEDQRDSGPARDGHPGLAGAAHF